MDYRAKTRVQRQGDFTKNSNMISLNWWCNCGAANLAIIIYTRLQLRLCSYCSLKKSFRSCELIPSLVNFIARHKLRMKRGLQGQN
jgi:hypothetical protein